MAIFGEVFRKLGTYEDRVWLFGTMLDIGRSVTGLHLIGAGKTAEVYEIRSDHEISPKLVVKTPPFMMLDTAPEPYSDGADAFDKGSFSVLREMDALSRIGSCGFVNMAQYAVFEMGVPALIFRKRDADLRQLVMLDSSAGDAFVRLAVLHMVARGLVRAQEKGVLIHQDLKPENILIDFYAEHFNIDGDFPALVVPRINDFEFTNRIIDGKLRGFRPYLPAEHYKKDKAELTADNRYDVYSLAVIAYELLVGGFHPLQTENPKGLHCSAYVNGLSGVYASEEKWKKWARKPSIEKPLNAVLDRALAGVLSSALAPESRNRPTVGEMAGAFRDAMVREDARNAQRIGVTIEYIEGAGETGSGAEARFPEMARKIIQETSTRQNS